MRESEQKMYGDRPQITLESLYYRGVISLSFQGEEVLEGINALADLVGARLSV